jgi:hypothetical protein
MTEETKPSGYLSRGSGGELLSPEALAILDALPIEEKSIVLQNFFHTVQIIAKNTSIVVNPTNQPTNQPTSIDEKH